MLVVAIAMRRVLAAAWHNYYNKGMLTCGVAMATSVPLTLAVVNGPWYTVTVKMVTSIHPCSQLLSLHACHCYSHLHVHFTGLLLPILAGQTIVLSSL